MCAVGPCYNKAAWRTKIVASASLFPMFVMEKQGNETLIGLASQHMSVGKVKP